MTEYKFHEHLFEKRYCIECNHGDNEIKKGEKALEVRDNHSIFYCLKCSLNIIKRERIKIDKSVVEFRKVENAIENNKSKKNKYELILDK